DRRRSRAAARVKRVAAKSPELVWRGAKETSPRQIARALGGGGDRRRHEPFESILAHQHVERGSGRAPGRGDVLSQSCGVERRALEQLARACDRGARERGGERGR